MKACCAKNLHNKRFFTALIGDGEFELLKPRVSFKTNERMLVERVRECMVLQIHDKTKCPAMNKEIPGFHTWDSFTGFNTLSFLNMMV